MVLLNMAEEPDDRLFQAEVLAALVIMLTVLESDRFLHHNTVPVMVVSVMARLQARVLHCHYSHEGLVVNKSRFFSFTESESANMDIVMSLMASKAVGDTKVSTNLLKASSKTVESGLLRMLIDPSSTARDSHPNQTSKTSNRNSGS
jgi:hypothetical protein